MRGSNRMNQPSPDFPGNRYKSEKEQRVNEIRAEMLRLEVDLDSVNKKIEDLLDKGDKESLAEADRLTRKESLPLCTRIDVLRIELRKLTEGDGIDGLS